MHKILTIIALCACVSSLSAQDTVLSVPTPAAPQQVIIQPQHFGYLAYSEVLKAMPEYQQAMKSLKDLKASYDQELQRAEQDFSKKFSEYIDGQKSFPENIMLKRQKELQQLMEQSMQFKSEAQELLAPVHARLKQAITTVGKRHSYAYVLNIDGNTYPYISGEGEAEDCTDSVLSELGIK